MANQATFRLSAIRLLTVAHDGAAAAVAMLVGLSVRLGLPLVWPYWPYLVAYGAIVTVTGYYLGLNSGIWRYASLSDMTAVVKTATISILVFGLLTFFSNRLGDFPRSAMATTWCFTILFLAGSRTAYRLWRTRRLLEHGDGSSFKSALVVGATDDAETFIKLVGEGRVPGYRVVGIIDEGSRRTGRSMRGVRVIDTLENLETALINLGRKGIEVDCLILARNGKVHGEAFDKLAGIAQSRGISLVRIPEVRDLIGQPSADRLALEPVDLEDLLPRREITLKNDVLNGVFDGSAVLVTGAGGSLGSELCQQVLRLKPRRLVLFDNSEYLLNQIETTLRTTAGEVEIIPLIGNVRDRAEVFAVFEGHAPEYVFHCAALKHVPIVERQPIEGVKTNVAGTLNVADAALAVGAKAMVLISTDKAVRPTSLMGATKRIAEMYCQSLDFVGKTRFVTVRFGNVLGSAGSVVPLFSQQIASGGPVTVTHPDIERYFMSIPEAVHLVLHATGYGISTEEGDRGRIFVLDMGAPVKIVDIARKLIWLKGLRPNKDIAIEFVGLRPGEKMFEELFQGTEQLVATGVDGVLAAEPRHQFDRSTLVRLVNSIRTAAEEGDLPRVKRALLDLVPDYAAMPERFVVSSPATREKLRVVHGELGA